MLYNVYEMKSFLCLMFLPYFTTKNLFHFARYPLNSELGKTITKIYFLEIYIRHISN